MSFEIKNNNIKLTRGDTLRCKISITTINGEYTPQLGDSITFGLSKSTDEGPILLINIPWDTCTLEIMPDDTKNLECGDYVYDAQITLSNGDVYTFITVSKFTLTPEVVR